MPPDGEAQVLQQPDTAETEAAGREWLGHWRAGPTRRRWDDLPLQVGDAAPSLDLVEARSGRTSPLSSAWTGSPALLLFWRHFGCSCGMDRAARLRDELPQYEEAGAEVVIVGQGEPERAAAYRERQQLEPPILCDRDYRAYSAFGVLEGKPSQVLFDAPDEFLSLDPDAGDDLAESRRGSPRELVDNPWILPTELVVDTGGVIRLAYRWQYCEDYPDPRVHVAAIKEARGLTWSPNA